MKKIVVFASGGGTNFQKLLDGCKAKKINAEIVLLVTNNPKAGAIQKAKKAGIEYLIAEPKKFKSAQELDTFLSETCAKKRADLICLAGYLLKIGPKMLKEFSNKIMNIHPALLPAFGGKGLYGEKVHKAVLDKNVSVSGVTVHFVDDKYDNGPVILQKSAPVLKTDNIKTLAEKVQKSEHIIYPEAVKLFCEDRIKIKKGKVSINYPPLNISKTKTALISVSDKTGLVEFAKKLSLLGIEIISTSGTANLLNKNNIAVTPLESITGFNEILSGRVKTLHPSVHAGILFDRTNKLHIKEMTDMNLKPIDMVVVNLYPFKKTAKKIKNPFSKELIEQIDIGGVTLLRAAAKNFETTAVISDPSDYKKIVAALTGKNNLSKELKRELAVKAFKHTSDYDTEIFNKLSNDKKELFPKSLTLELNKIKTLRYGENPHQASAVYSAKKNLSFKQIHGKELSYNNLLDFDAAWQLAGEFKKPAAVIVKHTNPCGTAESSNLKNAFTLAWNSDPLSAFGSIIAVNRKLDTETAKLISKYFVEVVAAPSYDKKALDILKKKKNIRILQKNFRKNKNLLLRSLSDEILISTPDDKLTDKWQTVTKRKITKSEKEALTFAYKICKHLKSNAVALTCQNHTIAAGAGQMSRVDAVKTAAMKYKQYLKQNKKPKTLVMASDAFFPFSDAIKEAKKLGVTAIVQPGGSMRDKEVIDTCNGLAISMIFTGARHFKH